MAYWVMFTKSQDIITHRTTCDLIIFVSLLEFEMTSVCACSFIGVYMSVSCMK